MDLSELGNINATGGMFAAKSFIQITKLTNNLIGAKNLSEEMGLIGKIFEITDLTFT